MVSAVLVGLLIGVAGAPTSSASSLERQKKAASQERCLSARRALGYYRGVWSQLRAERGASTEHTRVQPRTCAHVRWAIDRWIDKAVAARESLAEWHLAQRTIREQGEWNRAVEHIQKAYPGTSSWLLSCSSAEGGWGRWVTYGGGSYYPGFETRYVVGGPLQFKWPTFKGMYRRGLDDLHRRGFRVVDMPAPDEVAAWLSFTGQAIAGAWARYTGNDASHWSASWGNGC